MIDPLLEIGPHVTALPVVHGSGDFAWEIRRLMLAHEFDCLAVPLPGSFQSAVESAILHLPTPSIVVQRDRPIFQTQWQPGDSPDWEPAADDEDEDENEDEDELRLGASFVPIDPCQPVIAAIRTAMGDRLPRRFIDLETSRYRPHSRVMPDAYALKQLPIQRFAAAVLPHIEPARQHQWQLRVRYMAWQLKQLSIDFKKILFVPSILDWPWIREAFLDRQLKCPDNEPTEDVEHFQVDSNSLYFLMGELPYITDLYETARSELEDDANLSIDGVKDLLIASRETYRQEYRSRARKITPKLLAQCLKYIRNLTLIDHCFTPQLTTIVTAAQQVAGDGYALHVLEQAKQYRFRQELGLPQVRMSLNQIGLPDDEIVDDCQSIAGSTADMVSPGVDSQAGSSAATRIGNKNGIRFRNVVGRPRMRKSRISAERCLIGRGKSWGRTWPKPKNSQPASKTGSTFAKPCDTGTTTKFTSKYCRRRRENWTPPSCCLIHRPIHVTIPGGQPGSLSIRTNRRWPFLRPTSAKPQSDRGFAWRTMEEPFSCFRRSASMTSGRIGGWIL